MTDTLIRGATPADAHTLLRLIDIASGGFVKSLFASILPPGTPVDEAIVARMAEADSGLSFSRLWVAEIDGAVAGFIALDETPETAQPIDPDAPAMFRPLTELENEAPGCCLINLLASFPEFRGRGAGQALMAFAQARRGPNGLCLTVGDTNRAAQAFYERRGFRIAGRRPVIRQNWDTSYSEWFLMVHP